MYKNQTFNQGHVGLKLQKIDFQVFINSTVKYRDLGGTGTVKIYRGTVSTAHHFSPLTGYSETKLSIVRHRLQW